MMTIPELKIIETPGGEISYRENGSGPILLLMHGIGGNSRSWRSQLDTLSNNFRVIAWDAPAYGKSAQRGANLEEYTKAVIEFLDALSVATVNLLGHSMGGVVAQGVAGFHPDRVKKLVLSSTFMGHGSAEGAPLGEGYRARLEDIKNMSPDEFGRARASSMLSQSASSKTRQEVASIAAEVTHSGLLAACKMLHHADTRDQTRKFKMPVLVLTGEQDGVVKPARSREMASLIPEVEMEQLSGVGHAGYLENPEKFNLALENFLNS